MKLKEKIEKLKLGYYIEFSKNTFMRRIFLRTPDGEDWIDSLNLKEFESMLKKGLIRLHSQDNEMSSSSLRSFSKSDTRKYVYNGDSN